MCSSDLHSVASFISVCDFDIPFLIPWLIQGSLTLEDVIAVARHGATCEINQEAKKAVEASRKIVDDIVREKRVVYGVTTGFGSLCNVSISPEDTTQLQENLIRTHSSGYGDPLPEDAVRAIMLIRINSLVKGYSGIRLSTVEKLLELLNKGVVPYKVYLHSQVKPIFILQL